MACKDCGSKRMQAANRGGDVMEEVQGVLSRTQAATKAAELVDILVDQNKLSPSDVVTVAKMVINPSLQKSVDAMSDKLKGLNAADMKQILNVINSLVMPIGPSMMRGGRV